MGICGSNNSAVNFRGSYYHKSVTFGKRRVKDGECCAIWDSSGQCQLIEGPAWTCVINSDVRFLDRFQAQADEYLRVIHRDGRRTHMQGPCFLFMNPVEHTSVTVESGIVLDASQAVVVYREVLDEGAVCVTPLSTRSGTPAVAEVLKQQPPYLGAASPALQRAVIKGPTTIIPGAHERFHEFKWDQKTRPEGITEEPAAIDPMTGHSKNYHCGKGAFIKLSLGAAHVTTQVNNARTKDELHLTIDLVVTYELANIDMLLASGSVDPYHDLHHALNSDVTAFTSQHKFEEFVANTTCLNQLTTFPDLTRCAEASGFFVKHIAFRGYSAPREVQEIHDASVRKQTELAMRQHAEMQERSLLEAQLAAEGAMEDVRHKMEMVKMAHEVERQNVEREAARQRSAQEKAEALEEKRAVNDEKIRMVKDLAAAGVDVTAYLVAEFESTGNNLKGSK